MVTQYQMFKVSDGQLVVIDVYHQDDSTDPLIASSIGGLLNKAMDYLDCNPADFFDENFDIVLPGSGLRYRIVRQEVVDTQFSSEDLRELAGCCIDKRREEA